MSTVQAAPAWSVESKLRQLKQRALELGFELREVGLSGSMAAEVKNIAKNTMRYGGHEVNEPTSGNVVAVGVRLYWKE